MGHPWQIVVGPRGAKAGTVELKRRVRGLAEGERVELSLEDALARVAGGGVQGGSVPGGAAGA